MQKGVRLTILLLSLGFIIILTDKLVKASGLPNKAPVITGRGHGARYVALTFDDSPNEETTTMILDILKRYNVPASFFLTSTKVKESAPLLRDLINRMFEEGHFVGSQLIDQNPSTKPKLQEIQQDVEDAEIVLKEITGFRPFLIRVPHGSLNDRTREYLGAKAYAIVQYLTDLRDKAFTRSEPFLRGVMDLLPPIGPDGMRNDGENGGILLLHDTRLTAKSLGSAIETISKNGYEFVPLSFFMLSTERKSLYTSYRCGRGNPLILDRMCSQLQPSYDHKQEWQLLSPHLLKETTSNSRIDTPDTNSIARIEYLYDLLREQLKNEVSIREEKQLRIENELGQVWNTTLSRIKKTYSQLGERLDSLETRFEGKLEKELETVNWNLAKDLEELIDEIDMLKQDREDRIKTAKLAERFQRLVEKHQQQILRIEMKLQQVVNVAMGFVLILVLFLLFASLNRGWGLWMQGGGERSKHDKHSV